jgi:hypothetical protein
LVVVAAYRIGKERVFFGLAKALGVKVGSVLLNVVHKVHKEV